MVVPTAMQSVSWEARFRPGPAGRLVVLGLDGLPLCLARELVAAHGARLPHLTRLVDAWGSGAIRAELPELSPVNWTSFFTARGPGAHGVHGFTRLDPRTYRLTLANFEVVRGETVFDRLGRAGYFSKVVNLPNTYPARRIAAEPPEREGGFLVSGFVAEAFEHAVWPPYLRGPLKAAGYKLEADTARGGFEPELLFRELAASLTGRRAALELFWPDLAWDLFVLVLTETDRLFHFHFPALTDPNDPLHADCLRFLEQWDTAIGELLARFDALPAPKRLICLADHGFTTLLTEVNLNALLTREGWLTLGEVTPCADPELDAARIRPETLAFALDPGRVYLHRSSLFARGRVAEEDAERLKGTLRESLLALTWQGRRVMEEVLDGRAVYGPDLALSEEAAEPFPDLLCVPAPGFDLKAKFDGRELFGRYHRRGVHTAGGAFFHDSHGARPQRVRDVGRLLLSHFGLDDAGAESSGSLADSSSGLIIL